MNVKHMSNGTTYVDTYPWPGRSTDTLCGLTVPEADAWSYSDWSLFPDHWKRVAGVDPKRVTYALCPECAAEMLDRRLTGRTFTGLP